jgi:hypothetical protein
MAVQRSEIKDWGIIEYWNGGIAERICALFFVNLHSAIRILRSAIEAGGDLMLWIMAGPRRGKIGSSKFKAQNNSEIYNLKSRMN